jgi:hypothetical protein
MGGLQPALQFIRHSRNFVNLKPAASDLGPPFSGGEKSVLEATRGQIAACDR